MFDQHFKIDFDRPSSIFRKPFPSIFQDRFFVDFSRLISVDFSWLILSRFPEIDYNRFFKMKKIDYSLAVDIATLEQICMYHFFPFFLWAPAKRPSYPIPMHLEDVCHDFNAEAQFMMFSVHIFFTFLQSHSSEIFAKMDAIGAHLERILSKQRSQFIFVINQFTHARLSQSWRSHLVWKSASRFIRTKVLCRVDSLQFGMH